MTSTGSRRQYLGKRSADPLNIGREQALLEAQTMNSARGSRACGANGRVSIVLPAAAVPTPGASRDPRGRQGRFRPFQTIFRMLIARDCSEASAFSTAGGTAHADSRLLSLMAAAAVLIATSVFGLPAAVAGAHTTTGLPCTKVGTPHNDRIVGTSGRDVICGRGGNDVITGSNGNDVIKRGRRQRQRQRRDRQRPVEAVPGTTISASSPATTPSSAATATTCFEGNARQRRPDGAELERTSLMVGQASTGVT